MVKPWDESMKTLIRANPQAFTSWLLTNAEFRKEYREELKELDTPDQKELALLGFKLASLVFKRKSQDNLTWLIRSFKEMHDILHDTPIYQLILEEGREKGFEEGREQERAKACEEERLNLRLILVHIVQARYPDLVDIVKAYTDSIEDITVLRQLVIKLGTAQEREQIQHYLTTDQTSTH